jgi:drug/metabolite transporter (DMT)-like permease
MNTFVVAFCSILISAAAQFSLKAGMSADAVKTVMQQPFSIKTLLVILTDKFVLGGFLLYGFGAVVWLWVLSKWEVSKAYPMVGIGFLVTAVVGAMIGEHISLSRGAGIVMICVGIWFISNS